MAVTWAVEQRLRPLSYSKSHVILIAFAIDTPDSLENVSVKVRVNSFFLSPLPSHAHAHTHTPPVSGSKKSGVYAARRFLSSSWGVKQT